MWSNYLCEELLDEILLRLPSKSLLRFRSLSKSICARIDSPDFSRLHISLSPKKFLITHRNHFDKFMYTMHSEDQLSSYAGITPVESPFKCGLTVVGSCNGLVCFHDYLKDIIHLWNPSIRRKLTLRKLPTSSSHAGLDPFKFRHGFGFDPIIDDYKIVRFSEAGDTFVYTMKMNTWREVASPVPPFDYMYSSQCLFNGAVHWVAKSYSGHDYFDYILSFDLSSEVFSTIDLPTEPVFKDYKVRLVTIIKGCLAVICDYNVDVDLFFKTSRIWARNTPAASWSSIVTKVDKHKLLSTHGDILYSHCSEGIMVYNPETEARSRLAELGDHDHGDYIIDMITCVESLELLDIGTSCDVITRKKSSMRKRA